MGRPTKSIALSSRKISKSERIAWEENETALKGSTDKLTPPEYLSNEQKTIFNYIVDNLEDSGILGNLDIYVLFTCCIAIDRLQFIESQINANTDLLSNSAFMASKDKYTRDLYRCCNELSLSPQSRAKLANINIGDHIKFCVKVNRELPFRQESG